MATPEEDAPVGSICAVKNVYNHSLSSWRGSAKWSDIQDVALEERRNKELGKSHFLIHRFSRHQTADGIDTWVPHSIEVKCPDLRKMLDKIFHEYPNWYPDEDPYTFFKPYKPLLHRWEKLSEAYEAETDQKVKTKLHMLCNEVEPLISTNILVAKEVKSTGVSSFENLWLVFPPGRLVVFHVQGSTCLSKLVAMKLVKPGDDDYEGERCRPRLPYWKLTLSQIDCNGSISGYFSFCTKIRQFHEPQQVTKLPVYPFEYSSDQQKVRESLLFRGRKFECFRGFHVKNCVGKKFVKRRRSAFGELEEVVEPISGRVIVDAHAFYYCQDEVPPRLFQDLTGHLDSEDSDSEEMDTDEAAESLKPGERHEDFRPLTDDECIITVPRVKGFDLRAREWCELSVDDIQGPNWTDGPYDNLVLPEDRKKLLMSFVNHRKRNTGFDDFVKHKGEGIIILLGGPPGIGKTLTAEAVSEKSRIPLYVLSASELGSKPSELESALKKALMCCQLWGAMLLLDEADVFLEARTSNSLERNELVSIFLRQLEYYRGVLFLTTNRLGSIDPAFKSRVDLTLPLRGLDKNTREQVWRNFIRRLPDGTADISDTDFAQLAEARINGRNIKNLIKTALILASDDKPLRMAHLKVVMDIHQEIHEDVHESVDELESGNGRKRARRA